MEQNNLTIEELIHYGKLGAVEGLSPAIAERFDAYLDSCEVNVNQTMANEIEDLKSKLDEIESIASY